MASFHDNATSSAGELQNPDSNTPSMESSVVGLANPEIEIVPVQDIVMDYTDVFTTHENFSSREKLLDWVRARGNEHDIVTIVIRSDSGSGKKRPRLFLACERGGKFREFKKVETSSQANHHEQNVDKADVSKGKRKRQTLSKKCGCPFRLRGRQVLNGEWVLDVQCGVHNHPTAQPLEGHSFAGRLSTTEEDYVVDMLQGNCKPKDILFGLKQKFADNRSTIKTIYNVRTKNKVIKRDGRSQMEQLMGKLKEHGYIHHHRRCEKTDTVKDLFFAHPSSIELLRAFPKVLFMDCAYKTNRYKLPQLEIVGVTSTHMTFSIAVAYLELEQEDNYTWACTILKSLMDQSCLPNVIVTDREITLMNALERTFSTSRHFLCRWHISRHILANCKQIFKTIEKCDSFNMHWNLLVIANSESSFNDSLSRLQSEFKEFPDAIKYVMEQWVGPYKERFVACWTNNVMHFDNTTTNTTNRVESQHPLLKRLLGSSQGNFETCWQQIHTLIETSHIAIKHSFEKSRNVVQHKYKSIIFMYLRGMVSTHALNKIYEELSFVGEDGVDPLLCGCVPRKTCGLPCAHEISEFVRLDKPIPLDLVDAFWRKLDTLPIKGDDVDQVEHEMDTQWTQCIVELKSKYEHASKSEKLLMLKKVREILSTSVSPSHGDNINLYSESVGNSRVGHNY